MTRECDERYTKKVEIEICRQGYRVKGHVTVSVSDCPKPWSKRVNFEGDQVMARAAIQGLFEKMSDELRRE